MTVAISEQIMARAKTVLAAIPIGPKVFRNRTSIPDIKEMKPNGLINLYDGSEAIGPDAEFGMTTIAQMDFDLEAWVTGNSDDDLGPNMSAIKAQAVTALTTDPQLNNGAGSVAIDTRYDGMDRPVVDKSEGSSPIMGAVLRFQVRYQMSITDPTSQG